MNWNYVAAVIHFSLAIFILMHMAAEGQAILGWIAVVMNGIAATLSYLQGSKDSVERL
jgi:hypothetical protein